MEMDDDDNPPPPPAGRPNSRPVAAASAPQGALELMSVQQVREQQGKRFRPILSNMCQTISVDAFGQTSTLTFSTLLSLIPRRKLHISLCQLTLTVAVHLCL